MAHNGGGEQEHAAVPPPPGKRPREDALLDVPVKRPRGETPPAGKQPAEAAEPLSPGKQPCADADDAALSAGQRRAVALAAAGRSLALLGPAGTGKSFAVRRIRDALAAAHGAARVVVTASTGAAAFLVGGRTLHSFAGTGVGDAARFGIMFACATRGDAAARWAGAAALIVDEISMVDAAYLDLLDRVARRNRGSRRPFGGLQVIVVGDFAQLAPIDGAHAFTAQCWDALFGASTVVLTEVFRQRDPAFVAALHALRTASLDGAQRALLAACSRPVAHAVKLFARNADADAHNQREFARLPGPETTYAAIDVLHGLRAPDFPVGAKVALRVGARVMLRANVSVEDGLVNGACGVVAALGRHAVAVDFDSGRRVDIQRARFTADVPRGDGTPRECVRVQIPLILAWAISIHKSQGATLARCEVDLRRAWAAGQVYVALSRAATREGLCVHNLERAAIVASAEVLRFYAAAREAADAAPPE